MQWLENNSSDVFTLILLLVTANFHIYFYKEMGLKQIKWNIFKMFSYFGTLQLKCDFNLVFTIHEY